MFLFLPLEYIYISDTSFNALLSVCLKIYNNNIFHVVAKLLKMNLIKFKIHQSRPTKPILTKKSLLNVQFSELEISFFFLQQFLAAPNEIVKTINYKILRTKKYPFNSDCIGFLTIIIFS